MEANFFLLYYYMALALLLMHSHYSTSLAMAASNTNTSTDQSSLLAFKSHLTNDPKNILANNWIANSTNSVCNWVGVTCGDRHCLESFFHGFSWDHSSTSWKLVVPC